MPPSVPRCSHQQCQWGWNRRSSKEGPPLPQSSCQLPPGLPLPLGPAWVCPSRLCSALGHRPLCARPGPPTGIYSSTESTTDQNGPRLGNSDQNSQRSSNTSVSSGACLLGIEPAPHSQILFNSNCKKHNNNNDLVAEGIKWKINPVLKQPPVGESVKSGPEGRTVGRSG